MSQSLDDLILQAQQNFNNAPDVASLENEKAKFLGKNGSITALMKGLAQLSPEEKRAEGARINQAKQAIEQLLMHV
jgi:phenylalanyl-tRNA synthetase alpha chain